MPKPDHTTFQYICKTCGIISSDLKTYKTHKKVHQAKNQTEIPEKRPKLNQVQGPHELTKVIAPSIINKGFSKSLIERIRHPKRSEMGVEMNQTRTFKCDFCNRQFCTIIELQIHMKGHPDKRSVVECSSCTLEFPSSTALEYHKRIFHTNHLKSSIEL